MNKESQNELIPTIPGDVLHHEREKRGITLEEAASGSRIRQEHLEAIESGETQHIPQIYLKGYIRSYARFLGIPDSVINKHLQHAKGADPGVQSVFSSALPKDRDDRWFKATSYVLASVVVIALVWQFTTEAVRFSQGESLSGSDQAGVDADSPDSSEYRSGPGIGNRANSPASHLRASIAPIENVQPNRGTVSKSGAEGAWSAISKASGKDGGPALMAGDQSFSIDTSADSWVEIIDGNGKTIEMDLLRAGTGRKYIAQAPVKILLGRASSIVLHHNNELVDLAPYTRGNVARVTLANPEEPAAEADSPESSQPADS